MGALRFTQFSRLYYVICGCALSVRTVAPNLVVEPRTMILLSLLLTPLLPLLIGLAALWSYWTGAWDGMTL
jgi:hypothetical protein